MVRVKMSQALEADATGHGGDVVHIGFRHHGGHGGVHVPRFKLVPTVSLPQRGKIVSGHRQHLSRGVPSLRLTSTLLGLNGLGSSQRGLEPRNSDRIGRWTLHEGLLAFTVRDTDTKF